MRRFYPLVVAIAVFSSVGLISAQVATDPVGFLQPFNSAANAINLLANSDTLVSIPFVRPIAFTGAVASVSGNTLTITSPGFTASQFVYNPSATPTPQTNHYFALIGPGGTGNTKEGHTYAITANDTTSVTVSPGSGDSTSGIPAGAQIRIIPNWTLATIFPSTDAGTSYTATTNPHNIQTEVLIPNYSAAGVNQAFGTVYFYINSGSNIGWRKVGDATTTPHDDDPLLPDGYFAVRNQNGAAGGVLTTSGAVLMNKQGIPLSYAQTGFQDNSVSMIRPIGVMLSQTGLNTTDGSFVATTNPHSIQDELLLFNNSTATVNRSPSTVYFYYNSGWRQVGDAIGNDHSNDTIPAASALIVRKAPLGSGGTVFWTNTPQYSNN